MIKFLTRFSVLNPAFNNLLPLLIIAIGVYALVTIPQEINPLITFNWLIVFTPYPGASAQEVEQEVTIPIEDNIANLEDLDFYTSESYEGVSMLWVRFKQISDDEFDRRIQDVQSAVSSAGLPDGVLDTDIEELSSYSLRPVVEVAVFGEAPLRVLNEAAEGLQRQILRIPNVHQAQIFGMRDREIRVELDPLRMRYYHLANQQIIQAIQYRNLNLPGGLIKAGDQEYLLRTEAEYESLEEISNTVVFSDPAGFRVTVGDVATVEDTFTDATILTRVEGQPCLILTITKTEKGSAQHIVRELKEQVAHLEQVAPEGLRYKIINDSTVEISYSLGTLESSALMGAALVLALLYLFLGWRSALTVTAGIPIAMLLTIVYLRFTGETLNLNSIFGFVLVLGMVVDDGIVMVENCYAKLQQGNLSPLEAIEQGIEEVAVPVATSSLTTIATFLPLMLMPGIMGKFMKVIPLVVTVTLLTSLFQAYVILPGNFRELTKFRGGGAKTGALINVVNLQRSYVKLLVRCLRHRYIFMIGLVVLLILSIAVSLLLGFDLFAEDILPSFKVIVKMPSGTRLERTEQVVMQIAEAVKELPADEVDHVTLRAGLAQGTELWTFLPTVGQVSVNLVPHYARERSVQEIAHSLRERIAAIPGPESIEFQFDTQGPPAGADLQILIKGRHLDTLEEISRELKRDLATVPGVEDIRDDLNRGTQELTVRVDPDRVRRYGVTVAEVAAELRTAFNGTKATVLHDADDDVDVVVRYRADSRTEMAHVLATQFRTPAGEMVAFEDIASLSEGLGLSNIRHHDSERAVTIRASVDSSRATLSRVIDRAKISLLDLERRYPGYRVSIWGQWKEFVEAFNSLGLLFGFGMLLIYLMLVAEFKSLVQPFAIMIIIPISFIGAAFGLLVLQRPVTVPALYGFVALAGIAVNDSIIMVDFINTLRKRLTDRRHSLLMAGQQRLRPIILTSVTTIAGLLPMSLGIGGTSAYQSLAMIIVCGLTVSTIISLFGIPVMVQITDDLKARRGVHPPAETAEVKIILRPTTPRAAAGGSEQ